jgi:hypothetical protein
MSTAASIALILLIIESMLGVLIVLAICAGMVYLMHKLRGVVKRVMPKAQHFTSQVAGTVHDVSNEVAEPFIKANAAVVQVRATVESAKRRLSRL